MPGFAEATRLCLPAGAQRLHSVPKCSVQFRADWHPAPVWPALPRRSWRAWTTLRCATCTRCGLRSSVRRRGARTFRVRRPQRCQLEASACLPHDLKGQGWSASAAVGAHLSSASPLPPRLQTWWRPRRRSRSARQQRRRARRQRSSSSEQERHGTCNPPTKLCDTFSEYPFRNVHLPAALAPASKGGGCGAGQPGALTCIALPAVAAVGGTRGGANAGPE